MEGASSTAVAAAPSVEAQVENLEGALAGFLQEVQAKKKLLAKVKSQGQGSSSSPVSEESVVLSRFLQSADAVGREKKKILAALEKLIRLNFRKNLTSLLQKGVGSVIRSFRAATAETLLVALGAFMERGERGDLCLLLFVGADLDGLVEGRTALMRAVARGNVEAMGMLVEAGAGLDVKREGGAGLAGSTALHEACVNHRPEFGLEIVTFLLAKGAEVDAENAGAVTPLMLALASEHTDLMESLLSKGAGASARNADLPSVIRLAVFSGRRNAVAVLLDSGVGVDEKDEKGRTLLWWAIQRQLSDNQCGQLEVADLLISRGAVLNVRALSESILILHVAVSVGCADFTERLLEAGSDVHATDDRGWTALHCVAIHTEVLRRQRGVDEQKMLRIAQMLVSRGIDWDVVDQEGQTARSVAELLLSPASPIRSYLASLSQQPQNPPPPPMPPAQAHPPPPNLHTGLDGLQPHQLNNHILIHAHPNLHNDMPLAPQPALPFHPPVPLQPMYPPLVTHVPSPQSAIHPLHPPLIPHPQWHTTLSPLAIPPPTLSRLPPPRAALPPAAAPHPHLVPNSLQVHTQTPQRPYTYGIYRFFPSHPQQDFRG
uniref:Uncharacterized protein n=1 Tax=Chromera velia CCMP2878 TaxID=1169474 RepID=A0A0G4HYH0_9ALVE|eukprot:Cvel_33573.t1-p1 / transcript=Cvel_33573.t1 / gene=Cvel_33573 / organism=Chromera_velia_CCMP2878 / gene_product=Putative ankyrin repeat protein RF_0381, putative / transcript_product=Putative ankyrin repeat protein RF_0381, putative / location=Cvel_scaffold5489:1497-3302(+) / protein_length=602 / sequence_SO=supercontig / SO=protein_coding / is_pseudo=false